MRNTAAKRSRSKSSKWYLDRKMQFCLHRIAIHSHGSRVPVGCLELAAQLRNFTLPNPLA
jgi:hypothetical protein